MELDELKYVFFENVRFRSDHKSLAELELMRRIKSQSVIDKIKRNLIIELIVAFLFNSFPVYLIFNYQNSSIRMYAILMMAISIYFILYAGKFLLKVSAREALVRPLRFHLEDVIQLLQNFRRLYFISTLVLIPLFFIAAFFLVYLRNDAGDWSSIGSYHRTAILIYLFSFIGYFILMYFFLAWYLQKIFGDHLEKLKQNLAELIKESRE